MRESSAVSLQKTLKRKTNDVNAKIYRCTEQTRAESASEVFKRIRRLFPSREISMSLERRAVQGRWVFLHAATTTESDADATSLIPYLSVRRKKRNSSDLPAALIVRISLATAPG